MGKKKQTKKNTKKTKLVKQSGPALPKETGRDETLSEEEGDKF